MPDTYMIERTFLDITDTTGLAPGQTRTYQAAPGSYASPGTVTSSSTAGIVAREITEVEITPPRDFTGLWYQDLREVWLILDSQSIQHYINLSGYGWSLMAPRRDLVRGARSLRILFGEPLWRVVRRRGSPPNHPLLNTTPKFIRDVAVGVSSVYGVTTGALPNGRTYGAFRITVKGFEYTSAHLRELRKSWDNNFQYQTLRRTIEGKPPLQGTFLPSGALDLDTWTSYPGGTQQGQIKVNPYWRFAYNNLATQPQAAYRFSTKHEVGGVDQAVEDQFQDLGLAFGTNADAFILRGFGVRPVPMPPGQAGWPGTPWAGGQNLARAGWTVNGTDLPQEQNGLAGIYITTFNNPLNFGSPIPYTNEPGQFSPIPKWPGELLIMGDNAVPFVGANGSPIPADSVVVAYNGVLVERG
jgi:hypothetical protein